MSTPMFELPEHEYVPVNAAGQGPADDDEAVREVCWCNAHEACRVNPPRPCEVGR